MPAETRALLTGLIDYAGLFPPAALSLREVVANYAMYLASPDAWMLGRLVVPVSRLAECRDERSERYRPARSEGPAAAAWRISALAADVTKEIEALTRPYPGLDVDSCELKAATVADINAAADHMPSSITTFVEIPIADDPAVLIDAIATRGLNAKIRTGGVTPDAFPSPALVARFIMRCHERRVAFKATAGLHHPLRGMYRLTYADDAPRGEMFGFLNISAATTAAANGAPRSEVEAALSFRDAATVDSARNVFLSFGSCSFREPVDDLEQLGVL